MTRATTRDRPEVCDACGAPPRRGMLLYYDAQIVGGEQRGWVCWRCKDALVAADLERLEKLVAYLRRGGGPS